MSLFGNNTYNPEKVKHEQDRVGAGSFTLESDIYLATIKHAFYKESENTGAKAVEFAFDLGNEKEFNSTQWVTSGTAKGCKHTYTDKDGKEHYLAGFTVANDIALIITGGKSLFDLEHEEKTIKVYNKELQQQIPTDVPTFTELTGKQVRLAVIKKVEPVFEKDAQGNYTVPTDKTRESNEILYVFDADDKRTANEMRAEIETASFYDKWLATWQGKTKDLTNKPNGQGNKPTPSASAQPERKKVFGNKAT